MSGMESPFQGLCRCCVCRGRKCFADHPGHSHEAVLHLNRKQRRELKNGNGLSAQLDNGVRQGG